uniref:Secreted protein n=1 Tax=Steinernema glaseri TaxID=37863 RepID=A0A1I7ZJ97_9BILA
MLLVLVVLGELFSSRVIALANCSEGSGSGLCDLSISSIGIDFFEKVSNIEYRLSNIEYRTALVKTLHWRSNSEVRLGRLTTGSHCSHKDVRF